MRPQSQACLQINRFKTALGRILYLIHDPVLCGP
jgi:hypothetical protein